LATAAGASAGVVFGAGPIFDADVDASTWSGDKWLLVVLLAAAGAAAVVYVIGRLLALQVPIEITLDALPASLLSRIQGNQLHEYLPGGATDLADFKSRLQAYANAAVTLEAAAQAETEASEKARLTQLATIQKNNRDVYKAKRDELYALAAYELEAERLTPRATQPWLFLGGAAVIAVVAMAAFTFVTGSGATEDDSAAQVETPALGEMTAVRAGEELWEGLGLADCEVGGVVPVVVFEATEADYTVQTLGTPDGCDRYKFTLPRNLVKLVEVEPASVEITVAPSENSS
jgi:hypothetical protein